MCSAIAADAGAGDWWNPQWAYRKHIDTSALALEAEGQELRDVALLLRLHPANFNFFFDLRPDAGDLRFIHADGRTPLQHHVESFDPAAGVALIWVRLPRVALDTTGFHMYYGNPDAESIADPPGTFDSTHALVLHFGEADATPRDLGGYRHSVTAEQVARAPNAFIGAGLRLQAGSRVTVAGSPALDPGGTAGASFGLWLRRAADSGTSAASLLMSQGDANGSGWQLLLIDDRLVVTVGNGNAATRLETTQALGNDRWHHVALVMDKALTLYIDGKGVGSIAVRPATSSAPLIIGTDGTMPAFEGIIDEVRVAAAARSAAWLRLHVASSQPDSRALVPGEDESHGGGNALAAYMALMQSLLGTVRPEGWVILMLLALMALATMDVIIGKFFALRRTERADRRFLDSWKALQPGDDAGAHALAGTDDPALTPSLLLQLYAAAMRAVAERSPQSGQDPHLVTSLRADIEAEMVRGNDQLNARMVVLTIAVSGGPFLGLLGTVLGVMVTFASIAAEGEVNVATIAPGVAAALITTVMGLVVAIPALFGYNYLAGRVNRRISQMETFAEQLAARLARALSRAPGSGEQA